MTPDTPSRRDFLRQAALGAGLALAVILTPQGLRLVSAAGPKEGRQDTWRPSAWLHLGPDGRVTVMIAKSEMGQGITTALSMIVAEEMEADWRLVGFAEAPAGPEYLDPVFKMQLTGGSTTIRHMTEVMRKAGAAAREMLVQAAAQTWGVPPEQCQAAQGTVRHEASHRSLTYGQLAHLAAKLPAPANPTLKPESSFRIIGQPLPRLDIPAKVSGTAEFGTDVKVKGMLYGAVAHPPAYGAKAQKWDEKAALKVPGVVKVASLERGVGVVAKSLLAAWKGRGALKVAWGPGSQPEMDDQALASMFQDHLAQPGLVAKNQGNVEQALASAAKRVEASYQAPYLAHCTLEPMNCTAHVRKDKVDIWAPTQFQTACLGLAARLTGLPAEKIAVHTTFLGGGFGRRAETDVVEEAVLLSRATGAPVKVLWSRPEDMKYDFYRPGNICQIQAALDQQGRIAAWSHKAVCPSIAERVFPAMITNGIDPTAVEGIEDMEYEIPNLRVEWVKINTPVPVGFWRSVGNSHNAFIKESFIDELAKAAGQDPLAFRLSHLQNQPRPRGVLERAAEMAGWGKPLAEGRARGLAFHHSFGTYVAHVAEVSVEAKTGKIKVHRVWTAVDCGLVINPFIVQTQMEGGMLMGMSAALMEQVHFAKGGVKSASFDDYAIARMSDIPEVQVQIVQSKEASGGVGEPGLPPIAPALANAVCAATGARLRRLPLAPEAVLTALASS